MARAKKNSTKPIKRSNEIDTTIDERLTACSRGDSSSVIYIRDLVERTLKGEFGAILKALTVGRTSRELAENRNGKLSSDRVLGRIEMAEILWNDLEQYVLDGDALLSSTNTGNDSMVVFNYSPE